MVAVRLESSLLRLRLALFKMFLVAFSSFPTMAAISCMCTELSYLIYVVVIAIKYRHFKTIVIAISRVNISITIVVLTGISLYLSLVQDKKVIESKDSPVTL